MKNMKYSMTFGIALICVILFTACDNNIETPMSGYGRISISFAGGEASSQQARTTLPSTVFDKYVYTFTKTGETVGVVNTPGSDGFFTLEVGSYTVEVQAFTGDDILAAIGVSEQFNVGPGDNDPVVILLTRAGAGGQGEFSYTITYPAGAAAEITLQKWPGLGEIVLNPVNLSQGNGITQTLQLETGSYLLTVLIGKTGLYAGINEAVHIYPSLTTVYAKNYVDNDFLPKFPGALVSALMLNGVTQNSITLNPVTPPANGQTVEYGINTSNTMPSIWQTGTAFTGLSGGIYYIFARSAENDDYTAGVASVTAVMIVTTTDHWNAALTAIRNGGSGVAGNPKTYTIMVFGNVAVPGSTAAATSFGYIKYIEVTLKGSGTLSLNSSGSILCPQYLQTLIIDDENLTLQGRSGNSYAVVYVSDSTLELKNGTIRGNTSSTNGGGVYLFSNSAFTMSGGTISGNTATGNNSGGGVCLNGGGTFTMSGGTISGNTATGSNSGGGVYLNNSWSAFTMSGGIVYGSDAGSPLANTAGSNGGAALYVSSGTAKYGDNSNILPHKDNQSSYTNNTIIPGPGGGAPLIGYTISGTGTFTYDGSAKTVIVTPQENASSGAITVLYNGIETPPVDAGAYTVTFNVAAAPGFSAMTLPAGTITINRAAGATVSAPTLNVRTHNSITINPVPAPANGQTVEYARSSSISAPSSGWQTDTTFSGLSAGTSYYIFARSAQNTNYNTGTASPRLTVTTLRTVPLNRIEYYWVDQHGSLVTTSGGATTIAPGATLTITAQGTGYVVRQWHLNGVNTGQSGNTYNFSSYTAGKNTVGLFVEKDGKLYNTNIIITVMRTVTIDMYDSDSASWSGYFEIYINGIRYTYGIGLRDTYLFHAAPGDVVLLRWVSGYYSETNGSFIVYYADAPPIPAFTASNNNNWNGSNALIYRLRGAMADLSGITTLGSFTVP